MCFVGVSKFEGPPPSSAMETSENQGTLDKAASPKKTSKKNVVLKHVFLFFFKKTVFFAMGGHALEKISQKSLGTGGAENFFCSFLKE